MFGDDDDGVATVMSEMPMGLLKSFVQNGFISGLNIQQNRIKEQSKLVVVGNFLLYLLEKSDRMRIIQNPGCVEKKRKNWSEFILTNQSQKLTWNVSIEFLS